MKALGSGVAHLPPVVSSHQDERPVRNATLIQLVEHHAK